MAKKGNGTIQQSTQTEQSGEEPQGGAAPESVDKAPAGVAFEPEQPQGEPGPEDFERHAGARLLEDHARDLAESARLAAELKDVDGRIAKRGHVIAVRAEGKGGNGRNPVIRIGGQLFVPKARPAKHGGGMMLVEQVERREASIE